MLSNSFLNFFLWRFLTPLSRDEIERDFFYSAIKIIT